MTQSTVNVRRNSAHAPKKLAIVSTSAPRRCGIASFTTDLRDALIEVAPEFRVEVCAIDRDGHAFGPEVKVVIEQDDADSYLRAADRLASSGCDLVLIQHEYGIFGGEDGALITLLTRRLTERAIPFAVTLHTVLSAPSDGQLRVLRELCATAALVTVFSESALRLLVEQGTAPLETIVVIPHGAPKVLREEPDPDAVRTSISAQLAGLENRTVLTTFGLIGPGKGLEVAIDALADLVPTHPDLLYLIAGATHPEVARREGEPYRARLTAQIERLGVQRNVSFVDAFLSDPEVSALLAVTDVYVTPYLSVEQSSSGTLTFALAAGRPVVSTAYRYARDLISGDPAPGLLVPGGDSGALGAAIGSLIDDPDALASAMRAADALGATLTWPAVAGTTARLLAAVVPLRSVAPIEGTRLAAPEPLRLGHLVRLTEHCGIVQFARGRVPDPVSGSCVDDVARLGIIAAGLYGRVAAMDVDVATWVASSLQYLDEALPGGSLPETAMAGTASPGTASPGAASPGTASPGAHNLRSVSGDWLDEPHTGDHVGRLVWALGVIVASDVSPIDIRTARRLLDRAIPFVPEFTSLRVSAYAVLGLARVPALSDAGVAALRAAVRSIRDHLAGASAEWPWFESQLTYDNARLPQALIVGGVALGDDEAVADGIRTLDWYLGQVGLVGDAPVLRLVGNRWRHGRRHAEEGDEQPLDAAATVEALVAAWQTTGSPRYAALGVRAHAWFNGVNRAGAPLYDAESGGCRDGLSVRGASENEGAESTFAYHQSLLCLVSAGLAVLPSSAARRAPGALRHAEVAPATPADVPAPRYRRIDAGQLRAG